MTRRANDTYRSRRGDLFIDPYDDDDDNGYEPRRRSNGNGWIIALFVLVFAGVIGGAVWVFFFSDRGFNILSSDPTEQLAAPSGKPEMLKFVGLAFDDVALTMHNGERKMVRVRFQLTPESRDVDTRRLKLVWKSENPSVATVDSKGQIVARGTGTARIMVNIDDDGIDSNTAYCMVSVGNIQTADIAEPGRGTDKSDERPSESADKTPEAKPGNDKSVADRPATPKTDNADRPEHTKHSSDSSDTRRRVLDAFNKKK